MLTNRIRAALATAVAGAAATTTVGLVAPAAHAATTSPIIGQVAYINTGSQLMVERNYAGGGNTMGVIAKGVPAGTVTGSDYNVVWSPTGNTVLYAAGSGTTGGIYAADANGRWQRQITQGADSHPAISSDGSFVVFHRGTALYAATTDGRYKGGEYTVGGITQATGENDDFPTIAPNGTIAYERDLNGATDVWTDNGTTAAALITNAVRPSYSPDGSQIAFLRKDAAGVLQAFVVSSADGTTGLRQVGNSTVNLTRVGWGADGKSLIVGDVTAGSRQLSLADGSQIGIANGWNASVASGAVNHEVRLSGATVIDTAVSESRYTWASLGTTDPKRSHAQAVVITRQDKFYDAIPGSSLAVHAQAPLLYTPSSYLDGRTLAEVERILPKGSTVYLTGGTSALTPAVANAVTAAGYKVVRLGGATIWDTAVSIAKQVSSKPRNVLVLTGMNYLDAISAGATGQPIVLTNGTSMPEQTAAYLNSLTPASSYTAPGTRIWAVGGPGYKALVPNGYQKGMMPKWPSSISTFNLVGSTYSDTSLMVAGAFFLANNRVTVTTGNAWPDGLSGSAMAGHTGSPLLAFNPYQPLYPGIASYISQQATSLTEIDMLGGTSAIPANQQGQLAAPLAGLTPYLTYTGGTLPFVESRTVAPRAQLSSSATAQSPVKAAGTPVAGTNATR